MSKGIAAMLARPALGSAALMIAAALALDLSAFAQQQPPAWAQGRPPSMADSKLAPHPPRMTVTAPDKIPLDKLKVPQGFKVELWAHGMPGARMMVRGDEGTIFVGTRTINRVYAVTDKDGQRTTKVLIQGLTQPNGLAFKDGALYVAAIEKVLRYDGIEAKLESPPQPVDLTAAFKLPAEQHH